MKRTATVLMLYSATSDLNRRRSGEGLTKVLSTWRMTYGGTAQVLVRTGTS